MEKELLKESLQHGTTAFPIAIYPMKFPKTQQVLAHLHYHNEFELLVATKGSWLSKQKMKPILYQKEKGYFLIPACSTQFCPQSTVSLIPALLRLFLTILYYAGNRILSITTIYNHF